MIWNEHSELKGKHSILSPSGYSWINYASNGDVEALYQKYINSYSSTIGTLIHEYAAGRIDARLKLLKTNKSDIIFHLIRNGIPRTVIDPMIDTAYLAVMNYVNDGIQYGMRTEQPLEYRSCFGTSDAIIFDHNFLRVHDLKTGRTPVHMEQLEIYASLFCLEYGVKPKDIQMELRLYQADEIIVSNPEPDLIEDRCNSIIWTCKQFDSFRKDGVTP